jgi:precorrin-6A/cobalt-precorrin-6A reductase
MIGVFAGTTEGKELIAMLLNNNKKVIAFVATDYGSSLINKHKDLTIYSKAMDKLELKDHIKKHNIKKIIDATHPYAVNISRNLIDVSKELNILYYRFEREIDALEDVIEFDNYIDITQYLKERKGNILLSIGSNNLDYFTDSLKHNRLYVRVLPTKKVIEKCESHGLKANNIIAMQGPFTKEMNEIMMRDLEIKYLVTKNSGLAGGIVEKVTAAHNENVHVLVLKPPKLNYPQKFNNIQTLLSKVI